MTPEHLKDIFSRRGYAAAREVACATREPHLQSLVEQLEKKKRTSPSRPGKTARDRASGYIARRDERRARLAAECQARKGGVGKGKAA